MLEAVSKSFGHRLELQHGEIRYAAWERTGSSLAEETLAACKAVPAVLLGAVGHPEADQLPPAERPEAALLRLRSELGCLREPAARVRRSRVGGRVAAASPRWHTAATWWSCGSSPEDSITARPASTTSRTGVQHPCNSAPEIERIARVAFREARRRAVE